jgi:proline racemase
MAEAQTRGESGTTYASRITGGLFSATPLERLRVGEIDAVRSKISGQAFVTSTSTWIVDPRDPQRRGLLIL